MVSAYRQTTVDLTANESHHVNECSYLYHCYGRPKTTLWYVLRAPYQKMGEVPLFIVVLSQLVELKNGDTYNGHLVNCDTYMNINLKEVICTSKVRDS